VSYRQVGDILIVRVPETERSTFDRLEFFPTVPSEAWSRHANWQKLGALDRTTGDLVLAIQSFVVITRHHTILVDTCVGDHKNRRRSSWNMTSSGRFLRRLAAVGVRPEAVDYVICTHLHSDHIGWNTRLDRGTWVPTFSRAKYVMSEGEWLHWDRLHRAIPQNQIKDSVIPVINSGQAVFVRDDHVLTDEISLESTPGHTPHHVGVVVVSRGQRAVITGDTIHSPVQCAEPGWVPHSDFDSIGAVRTRRAFLEHNCDQDIVVCASHFPSPSFGRIISTAEAFQFNYA
jgi:glyoxylase-like metal-dependent hydrolase (beta-lactamase superfamily II)